MHRMSLSESQVGLATALAASAVSLLSEGLNRRRRCEMPSLVWPLVERVALLWASLASIYGLASLLCTVES